MPGYVFDLRKRKTQPYKGNKPFQARWRHPHDPRKVENKSFALKKDAQLWISDRDGAALRGEWVDPSKRRHTFAVVAAEWQDSREDVGPKTRVGHDSILKHHLLPEFGPRAIAGIDAADAQKLIKKLAKTHKPNTVRNVFAVLRMVLDFARLRGHIAANPLVSVERKLTVKLPRKPGQTKVNPLPHQELARLADAMPTPQDRAAVLVGGYCGLRGGEVWALKKNDVGIRRLRVDEKITEAEAKDDEPGYTILPNGLAIGPTKTYTDEPVAMPDVVAEALAAIIDPDALTDSFIFTDSIGGAVRHNNWYKRTFKPIVIATLAPEWHDLTFHHLRHACAALLIDAGAHPLDVKKQMRHSSIKMTMDTYGHLFPHKLDVLADALDAGYRKAVSRRSAAVVALPAGS
jgi:integrase